MIDEQLFCELQDLYNDNIKIFAEQNSGLIIEKINPLTIDAIEKVINYDGLVDKKYISKHYRNFTINPQPTDFQKGYTTRVEISPDISWEVKK